MQRVGLNDILYYESLKDYVSIYTPSKEINPERILRLQTMKSLEEKLPDNQFVRVHTSYSVALSRIESIERNRIYYIGKAIIPIGDMYRDAFYRIIER